MLIPTRPTPRVLQDETTFGKAASARFFWPIVRGIVLIAALWSYIPFCSILLNGLREGQSATPVAVFIIASWGLIALTPSPEALPRVEGDPGVIASRRRVLWPLLAYCIVTGIGDSWICAFLWLSRQYVLFSAPVVAAMALIVALCAALGFVVAHLTGVSWRTALLVSALAPCGLCSIVLRLRLLG